VWKWYVALEILDGTASQPVSSDLDHKLTFSLDVNCIQTSNFFAALDDSDDEVPPSTTAAPVKVAPIATKKVVKPVLLEPSVPDAR
jgi:hypothetical protein